ncbi:NAD-dependent epimerase/dehydratase family protein [Solitalea sp. MAHUQ-68]|uniref:NAD-dependent epimerase/dehydratase family protein n=1 Tax=Solitalea agri TaxID=2953739 RepID=A0A9X2JC81_9SPHI|nr:NAD-dependent epimerase/dehydratase family protein [Solitalea agri]MCO4292793.1 NAD-dependent epimerase/dehydratase family protein [Solitalea agri]
MILITGATGFLGSQLALDLLKQGKSVRAIKRSSAVIPESLKNSTIEWVEGDVLDYFSIEDALEGVNYVYHCAAKVALNPKYKAQMYRTNIEGTANVVNACMVKGVKKLMHVSSIAAVGFTKPGELITENNKFEYAPTNSPYAVSKYESENEVWRGVAEGLNAIVVNPSIIIGMDDWERGSGRIFGMVNKGNKFYADGGCGYVDVRDVSACMIKLMESDLKNERYVINADNLSFKELLSLIAQNLNKPVPSFNVKKWQLAIGWRIAKLISIFTGKEPALTKDTATSAPVTQFYSNKKVLNAIDHRFIPIAQSINDIVQRCKK